jgi:hypothetical protein
MYNYILKTYNLCTQGPKHIAKALHFISFHILKGYEEIVMQPFISKTSWLFSTTPLFHTLHWTPWIWEKYKSYKFLLKFFQKYNWLSNILSNFIIIRQGTAQGRGSRQTSRRNRGRNGGRQVQRENGERSILIVRNMPRTRGISQRRSAALATRCTMHILTHNRNGCWGRSSQQLTRFGNRVVLGSYKVGNPRILTHPLMLLSPMLPEDILLNIFNRIQVQERPDRHQIVWRNIICDCWRFHYGQAGGYCGRPVTGYCTGRNLRIHFAAGMSKPERKAAGIMQALDLTEATEGDGYVIFRRSFHGDSSSSNDRRSAPR